MQGIALLLNLSFEDLSNLCATNSEFRDICENDELWQNMYLRDYGPITDRKVVSWKLEYLLKHNRTRLAIPHPEEKGRYQELSLPFEHDEILKVVVYNFSLLLLTNKHDLYIIDEYNPVVIHLLSGITNIGNFNTAVGDKHVYKIEADQTYETEHFPKALQIFLSEFDQIMCLDTDQDLTLKGWSDNGFTLPFPYKPSEFQIQNVYWVDYKGKEYLIQGIDLTDPSKSQTKILYLKISNELRNYTLSEINAPDIKKKSGDYYLSFDGNVYIFRSEQFIPIVIGQNVIDVKKTVILTSTGVAAMINEQHLLYSLASNVSAAGVVAMLNKQHMFYSIASNIVAIYYNSMIDRDGNIIIFDRDGKRNHIKNPVDFRATNLSGYGNVPTIWRNPVKMQISYALYQSLADAGVISEVIYGNDLEIVYQGMKIWVSSN